ncbi:hypothetical protein ACU686_44340 [Yinghuangia aomiensis]
MEHSAPFAETSRRGFLRTVGAAGGAGVLYSAMGAMGLAPVPTADAAPFRPPQESDFALTGRGGKKVVILGGGIAGLATAYELGKAGYDLPDPGGQEPPRRTQLDGARRGPPRPIWTATPSRPGSPTAST